jgi:polysaccharide transporter, PST family
VSDERPDSLSRSAARGAAVTVAGQLGRLVVQVTGIVILSRLLMPSDIGVIAMVTAITGIGEVLRDVGLSQAAIQARQLNHAQRSNLFWLSTVLGALIGVIVLACAPLIAAFYGQPELIDVSRALALTFLFNGLAAQFRASLSRSLQFRKLVLVDTVPVAGGLVVAIALAYLGFGFWALVVQQIFIAFGGLALSLVLAKWLPQRPRRSAEMRPLLSFGLHLLAAQLIAYASRNIDTVVAGYRFSTSTVGIYARAFDLVMNPLALINVPSAKVATPVLARIQDDRRRFDAYLLRGQRVMLTVVLPILAFVIATADQLIDFILGPGWEAVSPVLQILAVAGAVRVAAYASYWIALSRGFARVSLFVNLMSAPLYVICVVVGSSGGIVGLAIGFTIATALSWGVGLIWYGHAANAPSLRLFTGAIVSFASVVAPGVATYFVAQASKSLGALPSLSLALATLALTYLAIMVAVPRLRSDLVDTWAVVRLVRNRKPREESP